MKYLCIIFLLCSVAMTAQDKLIFKTEEIKKGFIVSIEPEVLFFKNYDTELTVTQIKKTDLLLAENYKGDVYIFSDVKTITTDKNINTNLYKRNAIQCQPFSIFIGRLTFTYERFSKDNKIGFVAPLSLTFDPIGTLYNSQIDTTNVAVKRLPGVNFIGGLDVNFYVGKNDYSTFFIGPRIRYGTDMFLRGIEAYSVQTQFGWRIGDPEKKTIQQLSFGFGLVRILSSPAGTLISPKQSYGWYSVNYRMGIKW